MQLFIVRSRKSFAMLEEGDSRRNASSKLDSHVPLAMRPFQHHPTQMRQAGNACNEVGELRTGCKAPGSDDDERGDCCNGIICYRT